MTEIQLLNLCLIRRQFHEQFQLQFLHQSPEIWAFFGDVSTRGDDLLRFLLFLRLPGIIHCHFHTFRGDTIIVYKIFPPRIHCQSLTINITSKDDMFVS